MLKIKNTEFLLCFNEFERTQHMELYKFLEKLVYGECTEKEKQEFCKEIKGTGVHKFVENLKIILSKSKDNISTYKRKNIKDNMLEDYVIRIGRDQHFLQEINRKIYLKNIPAKNIKMENGDIYS